MPENKFYVGYIGNFYPWKNRVGLLAVCVHRMYETVTGNILLAYYKTQAVLSFIFISHLSCDLLCDIKVIMTFKQQKGIWHTWQNKQRSINIFALQWRYNERPGVSKHGDLMVCSTACSCAHQRKHQRSASLAFVREIHRWPVDCPHKGPVTRKMFPFADVTMAFQLGNFSNAGSSQHIHYTPSSLLICISNAFRDNVHRIG